MRQLSSIVGFKVGPENSKELEKVLDSLENTTLHEDDDERDDIPVSGVDTPKDKIKKSGEEDVPSKEKEDDDEEEDHDKPKGDGDDEKDSEKEDRINMENASRKLAQVIDTIMDLADFIGTETDLNPEALISVAKSAKSYKSAIDKQLDSFH